MPELNAKTVSVLMRKINKVILKEKVDIAHGLAALTGVMAKGMMMTDEEGREQALKLIEKLLPRFLESTTGANVVPFPKKETTEAEAPVA